MKYPLWVNAAVDCLSRRFFYRTNAKSQTFSVSSFIEPTWIPFVLSMSAIRSSCWSSNCASRSSMKPISLSLTSSLTLSHRSILEPISLQRRRHWPHQSPGHSWCLALSSRLLLQHWRQQWWFLFRSSNLQILISTSKLRPLRMYAPPARQGGWLWLLLLRTIVILRCCGCCCYGGCCWEPSDGND